MERSVDSGPERMSTRAGSPAPRFRLPWLVVLVVLLVIAANVVCLLRWPWLFVLEPIVLYLAVVVIGRITSSGASRPRPGS